MSRFPSLPPKSIDLALISISNAADAVDLALISISMLQIQWRRGGADLGMIWRQGLQDGSRSSEKGRTSRSWHLALIR